LTALIFDIADVDDVDAVDAVNAVNVNVDGVVAVDAC
jgi:hypothetical protein